MKRVTLLLSAVVVPIVIIMMIKSTPEPNFRGVYRTKTEEGYSVQYTIQPEENSFVQYIDSREVDRGTYQLKKDNVYYLKGNIQNIHITLNKENSFDILINKINNGKPMRLMNTTLIPGYSSTKFDDVEEYKELIK